jgi:hypothetical protein
MVIRTLLPESTIRSAQAVAAESAEHLGVDHAQAGAGQHGDGQFGNHGHVQGDAVAALQAGKIPEQGGEFIHPHIEFLVGDVLGRPLLPAVPGTK